MIQKRKFRIKFRKKIFLVYFNNKILLSYVLYHFQGPSYTWWRNYYGKLDFCINPIPIGLFLFNKDGGGGGCFTPPQPPMIFPLELRWGQCNTCSYTSQSNFLEKCWAILIFTNIKMWHASVFHGLVKEISVRSIV